MVQASQKRNLQEGLQEAIDYEKGLGSDILEIADYIHKAQVKQIADALKEVSDREGLDKVVVTGLGKDILCAEAAKSLGLEVKSMGDYYSDDECTVAPAIGTAMMMKNYLK